MATMNAEKVTPCGISPRWPSDDGSLLLIESFCLLAWLSAGVHSKTKMYMLPSNRDWTKPRQTILESVQHWVNCMECAKICLVQNQYRNGDVRTCGQYCPCFQKGFSQRSGLIAIILYPNEADHDTHYYQDDERNIEWASRKITNTSESKNNKEATNTKPQKSAAYCATTPATIATSEFPTTAFENIVDKSSLWKPR